MNKIKGMDGIELFTRFADKYSDKIEDIHIAEEFFNDFFNKGESISRCRFRRRKKKNQTGCRV